MKHHVENLSIVFLLAVVFLFPLTTIQSVNAQFLGSVYINPDGSVVGTNNIQRNGNIYTLTANISGGIQVQKNNIVIDGSGYTVDGNGIDLTNGVGQDPSRPTISNVTIENLYIGSGGIGTNGGGNDTFYNDYIPSITFLGDCYNNKITFCTVGAIAFDYGGNATITESNIIGNILVWLSFGGNADRNYWSDYLTKYPNATEIDNSGIGNQPYVYATVQNYTQTIYYQDNHPLMNPVAIPLMGSNPLGTSSTVPEFPSSTIYIRADGSIEPSTAPIQRTGNVYSFTSDIINNSIVVQCDNIVMDGQNFTVQGNYPLFSDVGISLSFRNNVTIKNVAVTNFQTEINLENTTQSKLINNDITAYTYEDGIKLANSADNIISNNIIYSYANLYSIPFSKGIALENCSTNTISGNRVTGNFYGIYLNLSNNNTLSGNSITKSEFGIDLHLSSNNDLNRNSIFNEVLSISRGVQSDSGIGIWLEVNSTYNQVHQNIVKNNGEAMRVWDFSSNNTIYENNFINNTNQISIITTGISDPQSIPIPNSWDNGTVGNYWSDYQTKYPNATEIDNSGMGNTPYLIDSNNIDNHPLMKPVAIPELPDGTQPEPFPTTLIVVAVIATVVAVFAIGVNVYFKKRKHYFLVPLKFFKQGQNKLDFGAFNV